MQEKWFRSDRSLCRLSKILPSLLVYRKLGSYVKHAGSLATIENFIHFLTHNINSFIGPKCKSITPINESDFLDPRQMQKMSRSSKNTEIIPHLNCLTNFEGIYRPVISES